MSDISSKTEFSIPGEPTMHGDMPGDKVEINDTHRQKAERILPVLLESSAPYAKPIPIIVRWSVCAAAAA